MLRCLIRGCLCLLLMAAAPSFAEWHSDVQGIMGTKVNVTLWHEDAAHARAAIEAVMSEMRRIDARFSPYIESSELAQVNAKAHGEEQALSEEFARLIDKSLYFSALSEGAFDITYASLANYYDFRNKQQPSDQQRQETLPAINYRWLEFNKAKPSLKFAHPKVKIDLGGVAKGYAIDRAYQLLLEHGIQHASISAGGDSRLLGDRRGRPWIIGIKHPRQALGGEEVALRLPLSKVAVSTSGDYERYFIDEESGERIHHIIRPHTGESAREVMSVTILGERGFDTDPLSTSVFVLGVEKGLALVNKLAGFDAIIIDSKGSVHYSDGLAPGD